MTHQPPDFYQQVYAVVRRVPRGRVTSYGRVARMLGRPNAARAVGYALNALRDKGNDPRYSAVPWQRVINSQGRISIPNTGGGADRQAELLRQEGVVVGEDLRVDLSLYLWEGLHLVEIDDILAGKSQVLG
jgi:methylated-DNA-protein-cysteine methyltransferase-like protein